MEWVSILFTWHVAGNFILFVVALLVTCYATGMRSNSSAMNGEQADCCCLQVGQQQQEQPPQQQQQHLSSTVRHRSSAASSSASNSSFQHHHHGVNGGGNSSQHHSPNTVQTNVSPVFHTAASEKLVAPSASSAFSAMAPSFSYVPHHGNKNASSSAVNAAINSVGLTVVPTPSAHSLGATTATQHLRVPPPQSTFHPTSNGYQYPQGYQQQQQLNGGEESRASSVALMGVAANLGGSGKDDVEDEEPPPPAIVEAVPRDRLAPPSDEYRTLTREDELRQSIKLKESSLI